MKEKEKARKTTANRKSGGLPQPSPFGDSRTSLKFAGMNITDSSSRRT
jgi:hypothetical protein